MTRFVERNSREPQTVDAQRDARAANEVMEWFAARRAEGAPS
jgi:hypothetical protein